jgi:hsp70-interacting protein
MVSSDPFAWLGLLKWSLAYSDGTSPSADGMTPMSPEDKAFLEMVMKEGIIDENERMKTILKEVTTTLDAWRVAKYTNEEAETVEELLQELRDIVEQIDYARAFAAMKGLVFLLGCVQERNSMPTSTRAMCLGTIATMCQHNPPVQKELLELGALRILSDLFFATHDNAAVDDADGSLRARIIQAVSANVRSHDLAESVFCQLDQAPRLLAAGLGQVDESSASTLIPTIVQKRSLFFLRALVTSDNSTRERLHTFGACIVYAVDCVLLNEARNGRDDELVELVLAMVEQILEQRVSVDVILLRKHNIVEAGIQRIAAIRNLSGDDREFAEVELGLWERILKLLAVAQPDAHNELIAV